MLPEDTRGGCERRAARGLLQLSKSGRVRNLVEKAPVSRDVVAASSPGGAPRTASRRRAELARRTGARTIDYLGEDTSDLDQARATRDAYVQLLGAGRGRA